MLRNSIDVDSLTARDRRICEAVISSAIEKRQAMTASAESGEKRPRYNTYGTIDMVFFRRLRNKLGKYMRTDANATVAQSASPPTNDGSDERPTCYAQDTPESTQSCSETPSPLRISKVRMGHRKGHRKVAKALYLSLASNAVSATPTEVKSLPNDTPPAVKRVVGAKQLEISGCTLTRNLVTNVLPSANAPALLRARRRPRLVQRSGQTRARLKPGRDNQSSELQSHCAEQPRGLKIHKHDTFHGFSRANKNEIFMQMRQRLRRKGQSSTTISSRMRISKISDDSDLSALTAEWQLLLSKERQRGTSSDAETQSSSEASKAMNRHHKQTHSNRQGASDDLADLVGDFMQTGTRKQ